MIVFSGGRENWELQFNGMLMTLPSAHEQAWHVDGEHLFWEQPTLPVYILKTKKLRCQEFLITIFCFDVFMQ